MPTFDDLSIDDHNRYARMIEEQRTSPIQYGKDGKLVIGPVQTTITEPSYASALAELMGTGSESNPSYATFTPPKTHGGRCFSIGLSSFLSQPELENLRTKLEALSSRETSHE